MDELAGVVEFEPVAARGVGAVLMAAGRCFQIPALLERAQSPLHRATVATSSPSEGLYARKALASIVVSVVGESNEEEGIGSVERAQRVEHGRDVAYRHLCLLPTKNTTCSGARTLQNLESRAISRSVAPSRGGRFIPPPAAAHLLEELPWHGPRNERNPRSRSRFRLAPGARAIIKPTYSQRAAARPWRAPRRATDGARSGDRASGSWRSGIAARERTARGSSSSARRLTPA